MNQIRNAVACNLIHRRQSFLPSPCHLVTKRRREHTHSRICQVSSSPPQMLMWSSPFRPILLFIVCFAFASPSTAFSTGNDASRRHFHASTIDWPSLKLHFILKRDTINIYGQSEFDLYLKPVVSDESDGTFSVMYDGYVDFTEGNTRTRYLLVNGVAYATIRQKIHRTKVVSRMTHCFQANLLPPFSDILPALNAASSISSATVDGVEIKCPGGNLFETTFQGLIFIICASGASGFHVYSSDIEFEAKYLKHPVQVVAPKLTVGKASKCETVVNTTVVSTTTAALLTGGAIFEQERMLNFGSSVNVSSTKCSCKSTPRPCLFIHGLGIDKMEAELQDSFPSYWGNLSDHAPCCTDFKYMVWNSIETAWNNETQQQIMCDLATSLTKSSSPTEIADTIIVTHSMGGLLLAGAIANGKCTLAENSSWVATSPPMLGSMGSDYAQEACAGKHAFVMKQIGYLFGTCPVKNGSKSLVYQGGNMSSVELNDAYEAAQKVYQTQVYAAMCSNWYVGLLSPHQLMYAMLGAALPHMSDINDGMVELKSCAGKIPLIRFHNHYNHRFYVTSLNHADTTFYYGDGLFSSARKPVKWFECLL